MSMKTKSFRYSPEEHPKVEQWIQSLDKAGINFSSAIRRLIEEGEIEKGRIQKELDALRRQVESLRDTGHRSAPPEQEQEADIREGEQELAAVNTGFIRNRYFS